MDITVPTLLYDKTKFHYVYTFWKLVTVCGIHGNVLKTSVSDRKKNLIGLTNTPQKSEYTSVAQGATTVGGF